MSASNRNPSNQNQELSEEQEENIKTQQEQEEQKEKRLCDFCGKSRALLYCRADLAKLCFQCDREVHSTNPLFTKHTRFQLCDYCDSNPASIHCSTDNLVLCQNCDWESHRCSSSLVHDRRPLEGFTGCPSGVELSSILGFDDLSDKSLIFGGGINDGFSDSFVWEMSNIVRFDDLIVSSDSNQAFPAIGVPPLPKNLNTVCGKHKEEMIRQLCDILRFETCWKNDLDGIESFLKFEPMVPEQHQHENMGFSFERKVEPILPSYELNSIQWQGDNCEAEKQISFPSTFPGNYCEEENFLVLDNPDGFGFEGSDGNYNDSKQPQHPIIQDTIIPVVPKITPKELSGQDRELMLSRYKEKRKTRRYEKHIRYESRKVRAETRTRIKGRFAKISN